MHIFQQIPQHQTEALAQPRVGPVLKPPAPQISEGEDDSVEDGGDVDNPNVHLEAQGVVGQHVQSVPRHLEVAVASDSWTCS